MKSKNTKAKKTRSLYKINKVIKAIKKHKGTSKGFAIDEMFKMPDVEYHDFISKIKEKPIEDIDSFFKDNPIYNLGKEVLINETLINKNLKLALKKVVKRDFKKNSKKDDFLKLHYLLYYRYQELGLSAKVYAPLNFHYITKNFDTQFVFFVESTRLLGNVLAFNQEEKKGIEYLSTAIQAINGYLKEFKSVAKSGYEKFETLDYISVLANCMRAYKILNPIIADINIDIGHIYLKNEKNKDALKYYILARKFFSKTNFSSELETCNFNIVKFHEYMKQYPNSSKLFQEVKTIYETNNLHEKLAGCDANITKIFTKLSKNKKALEFNNIIQNNISLDETYKKYADFEKAIQKSAESL